MGDWSSALAADLRAWVSDAGVEGQHRLLVLHGTLTASQDQMWRPELLEATAYGPHGRVRCATTPADGGELWTRAVELWSDLRQLVAARFGASPGTGFAVDVNAGSVAIWGSHYCPARGPEAEALFALTVEDDAGDPFRALLRDNEDHVDSLRTGLYVLLSGYQAPAPTLPGHPEGERCG